MRLEVRVFKDRKQLILIAESELESRTIDLILGGIDTEVVGEVSMADGYGEHYIRLEAK